MREAAGRRACSRGSSAACTEASPRPDHELGLPVGGPPVGDDELDRQAGDTRRNRRLRCRRRTSCLHLIAAACAVPPRACRPPRASARGRSRRSRRRLQFEQAGAAREQPRRAHPAREVPVGLRCVGPQRLERREDSTQQRLQARACRRLLLRPRREGKRASAGPRRHGTGWARAHRAPRRARIRPAVRRAPAPPWDPRRARPGSCRRPRACPRRCSETHRWRSARDSRAGRR